MYTDIPTRAEIDALWQADASVAVSIYLETTPESSGEAERIAYKNAVRDALARLGQVDKDVRAGVTEELAILEDDAEIARQLRRGGYLLRQVAEFIRSLREAGGADALNAFLDSWQDRLITRSRNLLAGAGQLDAYLTVACGS